MDSQSPLPPGDHPRPAQRVERIPHVLPPLQPAAQTSGLGVGDIYYTLFRHKWKIFLCSVLGMLAAMVYRTYFPPPYQSEARLFIRYVVTEAKATGPVAESADVKSPDMRGETILESEQEILTSLDLSRQVAEAIGPAKILAKAGGGSDADLAAAVINKGLTVDVPRNSSVIHVMFEHPDGTIVQPVLAEIISHYLKTHVEIHRAVGIIGDFLTQETDLLRNRLAQTEEELRKARNKAGVISLDESKKNSIQEMARIRDELLSAQAELAERTSVYNELAKPAETPAAPANLFAVVPPAKANEYRWAQARLEMLQKREQDLLAQFTPENSRVVEVRTQLAETEAAKKKLEDEFPSLGRYAGSASAKGPGTIDLQTESARITALQAKIKVLTAQLEQIRSEAATVDREEGTISELLRKKELEEANYRYYAARVEQSRINEALGNGKVSNISQIQNPSPPRVDRKATSKIIIGLAVGGVVIGLVWAFVIEMFLDRSVRRPVDVEKMLGLPLFLTIPALARKKRRRPKPAAGGPAVPVPTNGVPLDKDATQFARPEDALLLHTYHETLRDRLISYFESRNLTHKPKLVAVTGLDRSSGVTTTAAGLASCLSETGEGNVLLVDMTAGQGSAQQFYRGKEVCGLEEIFSVRDSAQVQDKLYVVAEEPGQDRLSRILPQRFNKLVPQLKASNFDYIIFDMPPVSQISITPRLAGFMDMVLLVIESEKTDQNLVQRATALLAQSKSHVGAVLNKSHSYVPKRLHQDHLGNL
jgi:succinoglycan biosynthesis transport protein ExoP